MDSTSLFNCGCVEPQLSQNALDVLNKRYFLTKEDGTKETPKELYWRVATAIAAESWRYRTDIDEEYKSLAQIFYNIMASGEFLPNSPTLMNAGVYNGQLSACFVLPIEDSIEGIFDAVKNAALIHKSGGGTGFSFSRLRPKSSRVGSTGGVASGPLSFLRIFDCATEQIKQGGKRRGANMGILRIDHPDIIEFIKAKEVDGVLSNFNLSVAITDTFMAAVHNNKPYELIDPHTNAVSGALNAQEVWDLLINRAWKTGEPGIIFIDTINKQNPTAIEGDIEATNPCGEQPLLPNEACNLGSINLSKFYDPSIKDTGMCGGIDWKRLEEVINNAVLFLDNVIDANHYPLPQINEQVKNNRKIGLGVMGWADLLYLLRIPYNSEEAIELAGEVMMFINATAHKQSCELAKKRGAFPAYNEAKSTQLFFGNRPHRNATCTTIAPTGTLSIIAECSSGIEPLFALAFTKTVMDNSKLRTINPIFVQALQEAGIYSDKLMDKVIAQGSIQDMSEIPADIRRVFVTAMDIAPKWHLRMQAAFQSYTDNAVSKTVNLPNSATEEDVRIIYEMAYSEGCKGVTVYRNGCRANQVLSIPTTQAPQKEETQKEETQKEETQKEEVQNIKQITESYEAKRPAILHGFTEKMNTGLGTLYCTVNELEGKPYEVFVTIGKSGHSTTAKAEAIGRLVSLALRNGIDVYAVIGQLKGIGGEHPTFNEGGLMLSIPDAVAHILEKHYSEASKHSGMRFIPDLSDSKVCPDCGAELVMQEGCAHCSQCTYSKCNG